MEYASKILEDAIKSMSSLPSIGRKSALRLILHLIDDETDKAEKISNALMALKSDLKKCKECYNFSDHELCSICETASRDKQVICVVETVRDLMAIEETGQYKGLYHVLGGVISPIDGIGPSDLNIDGLVERISKGVCKELIMAISPTIEGDTTIYYLNKKLSKYDVTISNIARGVSFGGELEYADELTLGRSILSRTPYQAKTWFQALYTVIDTYKVK